MRRKNSFASAPRGTPGSPREPKTPKTQRALKIFQNTDVLSLQKRTLGKITFIFTISILVSLFAMGGLLIAASIRSQEKAKRQSEALLVSTLATQLQFFEFSATHDNLMQFNEILDHQYMLLEDRYGAMRAEFGMPQTSKPDRSYVIANERGATVGELIIWDKTASLFDDINKFLMTLVIAELVAVFILTRKFVSDLITRYFLKPMDDLTDLIENASSHSMEEPNYAEPFRDHPEFKDIADQFQKVYFALAKQKDISESQKTLLAEVLKAAQISVSYRNKSNSVHETAIGAEPPEEVALLMTNEQLAFENSHAEQRTQEPSDDQTRQAQPQAPAMRQEIDVKSDDDPQTWSIRKLAFAMGNAILAKNITKVKRAQIELERAQRMDALGVLSSGMAHDFNNLLSVVSSSLELIEMQIHDNETLNPLLDDAFQAVDRAAGISRNLLSFARENKARETAITPDGLFDAMNGLIHSGERSALTYNFSKTTDAAVEVDPNMLETALLNLIINSGHAMNGLGKIDISYADAEDGFVAISVRDYGPGIPDEIKDRVKDPFFTTKDSSIGTGLGLSMVSGFCERWGGRLELENLQDGFRATIILPKSTEPTQTETAPTHAPKLKQTRRKILIVEDNKPLLGILSTFLQQNGHQCRAACSIEEAKAHLGEPKHEFDLLITDFNLGDGLGTDIATFFKSELPEAQTILMSGKFEYNETDLLFDKVIDKPFRMKDMLDLIAMLGDQQHALEKKNALLVSGSH